MAAVTICSDFGAPQNKVCHCFYCFPIYFPWTDGTTCMVLDFWMLSYMPAFSLSSFTFMKRLFSSSSLSAIRVISSAYLLTLIPVIWIPGYDSSTLAFCTIILHQFSSVQLLSRVRLFATPWITARQASLSITISRSSLRLGPSSLWYHPAISSSVVPFSSCPQYLPASRSFPMSQLFTWGGQSTGISASASVLPMRIQDYSGFPLGLTDLISLQSKGLSRVFSNTTVQKHQFFSAQPSLWSNSHIYKWLLEKPWLWLYGSLLEK